MKSSKQGSFYVAQGTQDNGFESFSSLPTTAGPWGSHNQHGGPPAALLTRAIEGLPTGNGRTIGRFTMDLYGPVPVGPMSVEANVLRPGRSVELVGASLYDDSVETGVERRAVARAQAWRFPANADGPRQLDEPLPHTFRDGAHQDRPSAWASGYLDAVEWRWVKGAITDPGPGVVWMRPSVDLVKGEDMTPAQRLISCVDSASGVSAELDPALWAFLNTELTVHVLRPPEGEWVCLDAVTMLGPGSVGVATSSVYDGRGLVARSAQALLIAER